MAILLAALAGLYQQLLGQLPDGLQVPQLPPLLASFSSLLRDRQNLASLIASMPSLRTLSKALFASVQIAIFAPPTANLVRGGAPESCPAPLQLSCHNTTVQANTCCFAAPGGQILQTQFWDTSPPTGPSNSWTVHGLW